MPTFVRESYNAGQDDDRRIAVTAPLDVLRAESFGAMLRLLRRRARLTQMELGIQVGYSEAHISRLERGQRIPDPVIIAMRFIPALLLEDDPQTAQRLIQLADRASGKKLKRLDYETTRLEESERLEEIGVLEAIPASPVIYIDRKEARETLERALGHHGRVGVVGMPGAGKTTLGAGIARKMGHDLPVFWLTFTPLMASPLEGMIRQIALFLLLQGHEELNILVGPASLQMPIARQVGIVARALSQTECLLCFDDVHILKDDQAWDALSQWIRAADHWFLLMSREEIVSPVLAQISLSGLNLTEGEALVEALGAKIDEEQKRQIYKITAGNPMFLRLAVAQLLSTDKAPRDYLDILAMGDGLSSSILDSFLDDLEPVSLVLLRWLSVFRTPVNLLDTAIAAHLQPWINSFGELDEATNELRRRQLIEDISSVSLHPLIAMHIYNRLGTEAEKLMHMHRLAAECCLAGGCLELVEIAFHLSRAGEWEQAADWITDQVNEIRNRGLGMQAVGVIDEMLGHLPRRDQDLRRRLLTLRADLLVGTLRADEAEENYRRALDLAPQARIGRSAWGDLALKLANCYLQRSKVQDAEMLLLAVQEVLPDGAILLRAKLFAAKARAQLMTTRFEEAQASAQQVLSIARDVERLAPLPAAEARVGAHNILGVINRIQRLYPDSINHWRLAIESAQRAQKLDLECRCMVNLGGALYEHGDLQRSLEVCREALAGLRITGDAYGMGRALNMIALLHHVQGELTEALEAVEDASELKALIGDVQGHANSEAQRAIILLNMGKITEGYKTICEVIETSRETGEQRAQAIYMDTRGLAEVLLERPDEALATLQHALTLPGVAQDNRLRGNLENHMAQAYLVKGDLPQASAVALADAPEGAGPEVEVERGLLRIMLRIAKDEAAEPLASSVAARAQEAGFLLLSRLARQLGAIAPASVQAAELPQRGWVLIA